MELVIDTSTRYAAVGLSDAGDMVAQASWRSAQNHSVELIPAIRRLFDGCGAAVEDLDAVFVARGPGGFSALRVGMSTAKALALAGGVPIVAIGTLELELHPYRGLGVPAWAILEAGRNLLYVSRPEHAASGADEHGYEVMTREELAKAVSASTQGASAQTASPPTETPSPPAEAVSQKTLVCGEAAWTLREWLGTALGANAALAPGPLPTRHPGSLARLAYDRLRRGDVDDADTLQPVYIRGSQFEVARRRWTP